jgi:LysR family glycine cleavage system transcriptional activator
MRLPPLNAVRIFETAGRLENFSKAASELSLTPGAVSRQVRKLEDHLGIRLFHRAGTEVHLTDEGRTYLETVEDALGRLEAGTNRISAESAAQPLHIWGSRFFIRLWLIPRLPDFHQYFPDQEVMITSAMPSDPMPGSFDVAIRLSAECRPGYRADLLVRRVVTPVCSPSYLKANPQLKDPQSLEHMVLLQTPLGADDWNRWYATTGAAPVPLPHRMTFTSSDMAYSAALDGVGIVLGRRGFFEQDVQKGALVTLFDEWYEADDGFYMIYRDLSPLPRRIALFRQWLFSQLAGPSTER